MYRPICLLLGLCLLLVACGGNTPAADPGPGNGAAGIATRVPTAPAPTEPPPTVRPTATPTQARPTPTPTRPRPTPTATIVPTIAPTPPPARLKVETTTSDQTGKCKVGIPAGFTAEAGASDAWFSADRLVTALLLAPDTTGDPTLDVATGQGIAGLQKLVKDFKESDRATGPGFRRVAFTGSVNGKSSWGTLYIRQFGLDFCQFTVTASAGTTLLIDPVIETMIGSLSATKPRPLPLGYLALGDSYAAGVGADDPERGGYAALFGGTLQSPNGQPVGMQNRGIPGATSADLLGDWPTTGPAGKSPLAQAIGVLGAGGIRVVTIDIGGNDILRLLKPEQPCAGEKIETDGCQAALREALETMAGPNLPAILDALVESAQAGTQILVLTYPNPYSVGQQSPTERRVDQAMADLNAIIANAVRDLAPKAAARSVTLTLVDIAPIFAGKGGQLTHILAAKPDIHPNNAGHAAIAEAIARAYTK